MENARGDPILMEGTVLISFIDFILFFQIITIFRFKVILGAKHPNSLITRWWWRRNLFHPLCRNVSGDRKEKRAYGIMNTKKEIIFCFCRRKERQRKCFFFTSRLIFYNTRLQRPHQKSEKEIYTIFKLCVSILKTQNLD